MTPANPQPDAPLPFDPSDPAFNRANALYLAHASDIAYHRAPAAAAGERLGLKALAFRSKLTRARGFLGVCDTHAVLSFRGTDPITLPNWLTVAVVRLVECGEYDGRVHRGFSYALQRAWHKVEAILDEIQDKPLFLTGHSMGGALAMLAGCRLAKAGRSPIAVYTYGAPRVGDPNFCAGYALPTYRVVNRLDLVPELPLAPVKSLLPENSAAASETKRSRLQRMTERFSRYHHVDTLVYIDHDDTITLNADITPWQAAAIQRAIATRGKSFLEGVANHMIVNYIRSLEAEAGARHAGIRRRLRDEEP